MEGFTQTDIECFAAISEYLMRKFNGRVKYNHEDFTIPAARCEFRHTVGVRFGYMFYFLDNNSNHIATYRVYEKVYRDFRQAYTDKKAGKKYDNTDLEFIVSKNGFTHELIKKAA